LGKVICDYNRGGRPRKTCISKEITSRTKNIKNKILAILAAVPAMPPKPSAAEAMATIKNTSDHPSMIISFFVAVIILTSTK
jgi:hypothetical protein